MHIFNLCFANMVQGKATDIDRAILSRSEGAVTLLSAIEGNDTAWESVRGIENGRNVTPHPPQAVPLPLEGKASGGVKFKYTGTTKSGMKKYITDFPADMDYKAREKVFKERIATVFNLGAVKLNTDTKKIQVMGDRFTAQKNIHGDKKATDSEMQAKVNSLYDIAEILNDSRYVGKSIEESYKDSSVTPKNQAHKGVKYWYKFKNTISMDGEIYDVEFSIRDKGKEQYQYLIDFHKKSDDSNQPYGHKDLRRAIDESSPINRVPQNEESVNSNSMRDEEIYSQGKAVSIPENGRVAKNVVLNDESLRVRRENIKDYKNIETLAQDLGMRVMYTKGLTDSDGNQLDGIVTSKGIILNSEADNISRFAATHEFSHGIKQKASGAWNNYQQYVIDTMKKDGRYYDRYEKKAAAYNNADENFINEEIAADYIGELFNNETELSDFIRDNKSNAFSVRNMWYTVLDKLGLLDEKRKAQHMWMRAYKAAMKNKDVEFEGSKASQVRNENNQRVYDEKTNQFTVDENVVKAFQNKVDAWMRGEVENDDYFDLGKNPVILRELGADSLPVAYSNDVMWKMTGGKHGISIDEIKKLPQSINNPLMVFKSATVNNAFVVITELSDKAGDPVIAAIHLNKWKKHLRINRIASIYGKENMETFLKKEVALGNLRYYDKIKSQEWSQSRGLQLPKLAVTNPDNNIILQKEDVVNRYLMQNGRNYAKKSISGTRMSDMETIHPSAEADTSLYTREAIEAENAELRKQLEKAEAKNVRQKISWNKSEVKKKIDSDYNYIRRMVMEPTDARHIPEDMRASAAYLMDCFDFETKQIDRIRAEGKEMDSPTAVKLSKMYDAYADIMRKAWGISPGNTENFTVFSDKLFALTE